MMVLALAIGGCGSAEGGASSSEAAISSVMSSSSESSSSSSAWSSSSAAASARTNSPIIEVEPKNWYVRLIAEDAGRGMSTENAQLGQLDRANASSENLTALKPFVGPYIDIVLLEANTTQELKGSFHPSALESEDSWRFKLKTDDPNSKVVVSWRGLYVLEPYTDDVGRQRYRQRLSHTNPLLKKMQVVDETTGEILPVVTGHSMTAFVIDMNGATERTFRWELLTQKTQAKATQQEAVARARRSARMRLRKPSFDLDRPPLFEGLK